MIPRQRNEPLPERDRWAKYSDTRQKHHYAAGAWPEVTDTDAVIGNDDVLRQVLREGARYYGLGDRWYADLDYSSPLHVRRRHFDRLQKQKELRAQATHKRRQAVSIRRTATTSCMDWRRTTGSRQRLCPPCSGGSLGAPALKLRVVSAVGRSC